MHKDKERSMESEMYLVRDAKMDILHGLNNLTDKESPSPEAIWHMAHAYEKMLKAELMLEGSEAMHAAIREERMHEACEMRHAEPAKTAVHPGVAATAPHA